jgi:hypothetical protein
VDALANPSTEPGAPAGTLTSMTVDCAALVKGVARFSCAETIAVSSSVVVFNCFVVDSWTLASVALPGVDVVGMGVVAW